MIMDHVLDMGICALYNMSMCCENIENVHHDSNQGILRWLCMYIGFDHDDSTISASIG